MTDIAKIDKNFKIETSINIPGLRFYSADEKPFSVYGVFKENGKYRRLPESVAEKVSYGVHGLHANTSGGRIRFATDSPYVAINVRYGHIGRMPHFTLIGSAGFDIYSNEDGKDVYRGSFMPSYDLEGSYEGVVEFKINRWGEDSWKMREITINMPTYTEVLEVYIGLHENAVVREATPYVDGEKPIVYYGHSITQGGCVSRPGYAYPALLSRRFNCNFINLGFSGSALGEDAMAQYIAGLDMKMFVCDYDDNAPSAEHLQNTHESLFKAVRSAHPDMPIIILSTSPKTQYWGSIEQREAIVYQTYKNAVANGDKNVYFVDCFTRLNDYDGHAGATVEGVHLNDIGFTYVAEALAETIEGLI